MKRTKRKYISSFMAMVLFTGTMTISSVPYTQQALAATDTNGHWAESTINKWTSSGYISGYPDGSFRPNNAISRAEFVTLANKAFNYNVPTSISFSDLDTSHWAYEQIQKGVSAGYIKGDAKGTFRPNATVTRQEAAVMMAQIKQLQQNANGALSYTDYDSIANWAKPYVGAVSSAKIMQGFPNGTFQPQTSMTRAEAVTALENTIFAVPTQSSGSSSSSTTTPNYNNSNNSSSSSSNSSNSSSSSSSTSDFTLEDASLRNRTIDGDLIISSSLNSRDVTLNSVTVRGTVKVQGGGTIKAQSCDFARVELDKSGVTFNSDSRTRVRSLEFLEKGKIDGSGYENVYVQDSSLSEATVNATVNYLEMDTDANLKLYKNADVSTLEVTSNAKDGEVTFTSGAKVDDMNIRGRIRIYGRGDINDMTTYVSGIRSSIKPDNVSTRGDGTKPSYSSGESGSSSSSSSSYDDLTIDRDDRKYDADGERYRNVTIEAEDVTFIDAIVYNRLTISREVEDGEVILDDITVRGDVYIYGGGKNSVIFRDCDIQGDIISDKDTDDSRYGDEPVALEFEDDTDVDGDIKVRGDTIIRAESDIRLDNIIVDRKLNEDLIIDAEVSNLQLSADCDVRMTSRAKIYKININANRDVTIRMDNGSYIEKIDSRSDVVLRGNGTVKNISTDKNVIKDSGIVNDDQTSTFVAVSDIIGIPSSTTQRTITLSPIVTPTTASYKTVKWSIDSSLNTAGASIANDTTITATRDGQVKLIAKIDNGKEIGTAYIKNFTITFTTATTPDNPSEPSNPSTPTTPSATVKEIKVTGENNVPVNSAKVEDKFTLLADINGTLGTNKVTWESSPAGYLKIDVDTTNSTTATAEVLKADATNKEITITAKVGTETGKTATITIAGTGTNTPTVEGINVGGSTGSAEVSVAKGGSVTLEATGSNLATDTTIHWGIEETTVNANTKITNATGKTATLNVSGDETATKVTVKAWTDEQKATNAFKREVTVSVPTVTNVAIAAKSGTNADTAAAKNGDEFTATATVVPNLLANQKVKWSVKETAMRDLVDITPSQDTKTATVKIKNTAQAETAQTFTVQAEVVKVDGTTETTISAVKTATEITIAVQSSQPSVPATEITGVTIEGIGDAIHTEDVATNNSAFKATANLNHNLQTGESIAWSFTGDGNTLADITSNGAEATVTIKANAQGDNEKTLTVQAQVVNGQTVVSTKTANIYIVGLKNAITIGYYPNSSSTATILHSGDEINLTVGTPLQVSAHLIQNAGSTNKVNLASNNTAIFTVGTDPSSSDRKLLTPVAAGTAKLTATTTLDITDVDPIEITVKVAAAPAPSTQSDEPMTANLTVDEQPVVQKAAPQRAPAAAPMVEPVQPAQSYVKNITLPTQRAEVGKNFDLSIAQIDVVGDKQFDVEWVVDFGSADTPDKHTVRMDVPGTVTMMAIVNGGQPDGEVYTKSFDIIFVEPQPVVEPVQEPEPAQKEEIVREPEQELEAEEPEESEPPVELEQPQEPEAPVVPVQPQEPEISVEPEQSQEPEVPVVPVQPQEPEALVVPVQPQEPEVPSVPEQPQEPEVPVVPEQPIEPEAPVEPEQPQEPDETEQTDEQAPKEDKSIMIIAKGDALTNGDIVLYAVNADDNTITDENLVAKSIKNAVWTIVKDDGTEATLTKNVLVAKKAGTIVVKVTIGKDETRIRTQVIKIK